MALLAQIQIKNIMNNYKKLLLTLTFVFSGLNSIQLNAMDCPPKNNDVKLAVLNIMVRGTKRSDITCDMVNKELASWIKPSDKQIMAAINNAHIVRP